MHVLKLKNIAFLAVVEIAKFSIFTPIILSLNVSASECFATGSEWFFCLSPSVNAAALRNIKSEETCCEAWASAGFRDAIVSSQSRS